MQPVPAVLAAGGPVVGGVGDVVASGSLLIAIPLAVLAGLASFASPCVLPLVPGYLAFVTGLAGAQAAGPPPAAEAGTPSLGARTGGIGLRTPPGTVRRSRVLVGTAGFVAGFTALFVSYGALFGGLGASLLAYQDVLTRILGVMVIVLGLAYVGLVPSLQRDVRLHRRPSPGLWGAPLLGVLFGLGWTPCIGPTLAAVQGLAFTEASAARGAALSAAYCAGLGIPFLVVGIAMDRASRSLGWARQHARGIQVAGGIALVALGLLLVTGVWGELMAQVRTWVAGWGVPL